uniref:Uncharacterized protein n=1 Tax=Bubo bubo TaxID=30461 RepID=A0A8C0FKK7_BUBBB
QPLACPATPYSLIAESRTQAASLVWLSGRVDRFREELWAPAFKVLSTGWGDDIEWVQTYEEGLAQSKHRQKYPVIRLYELPAWGFCPHPQAPSRGQLGQNRENLYLSTTELLVLSIAKSDENMAPDGHYVPRILFVDPSMTVRADLTGKYGNRMYTYEPEDIAVCE